MKRCSVLIVIFKLSFLQVAAQDTIKMEPSKFYSAKVHPNRSKQFAGLVKYAREDIIYSSCKRRIEYCYYYDEERHCFGQTYEIINDSILMVDQTRWHFQKLGNTYSMWRFDGKFIEFGTASALIPFTPESPFVTTTSDQIDTLWTTDYSTDDPSKPYDRIGVTFHQSTNSKTVML